MSVYYVRSPASGLVKIGFAADARQRFSKIQSDCPDTLVLVAVEDGDMETESARHAQFAEFRARGEWFRDEGALRDHVDALPGHITPPRKITGNGPLGKWIAENGMTLNDFAEIVGTTQATISRVCNGVQFPRRELMLAIVEATDWAVDANALLGIEQPAAQASAA